MSLRAFLHIPRRTAKLLVYSILGIVVVFLALTHTRVGRDGLRVQLEAQFNETFVGEIKIEQLQGNLLNTLYAENIQLFDSTGTRVIFIDAAILEPSWLELMIKTISMDRVTLINPDITFNQRSDATWGIADVFKRKDGRPPQLFFNSSDIRIIDGSLAYVPLEKEADDRNPFSSFSFQRIEQLHARLNIEIRAGSQLIDIQQSTFELPAERIAVQDLHGQMFLGKGRLELNELFLESDATRLNLSASIDHLDSLALSPKTASIDIDIKDSIIDQDAVKRLIPDLTLSDTIFLSAQIKGALNAIQVQSVQLAHGNLIVDAAGTVKGLPDSLVYTFDFANSSFSRRDLARIAPDLDLTGIRTIDPLYFTTLNGKGSMPLNSDSATIPTYAEVNYGVISQGGSVKGNIEIAKNVADSLVYLYSSLEADSLDISSMISGSTISSSINGEMLVEGYGDTFSELVADVRVNLSRSSIQGRQIDSLDTYVYADKAGIQVESSIVNDQYGTIWTEAFMQLDRPDRPLKAELLFDDLDIHWLARTDSFNTNLDGAIQIDVKGRSFSTLRGDVLVALDSSTVTHGAESAALPGNTTRLSLTDISANKQAFSLDGDVATVSIDGPLDPQLLVSMGRLWSETLSHTFSEIFQKPPPPDERAEQILANSDSLFRETVESFYVEQLVTEALTSLEATGLQGPHELDITFAIHQADLIHPWLPSVPSVSTDLAGSFQITSTLETFMLQGQLEADSVIAESVELEKVRGQLALQANRQFPVEDRISLNANMQSDSLHFIGQVFPQVTLDLALDDHEGSLDVLTKSTQRVGPQRLITRFELLPDRNTIHVEDLLLSIGNSFWTIEQPTSVDLYGQRAFIPGLTVQSKSAETNILQRIMLSGVLSPSPQDTASIAIENIAIRPISQFLNMEVPLGGLINGALAFTTTNKQPQLTGLIGVDRFSFDRRVVGNVSLSSTYIPGKPDVALRIEVSPVEEYNQEPFLPDAAEEAVYEENSLIIGGTFRLPRFNQAATRFIDAGAIDLNVDMRRVDVFFFEYIFANVLERTDGYLAGKGKIIGDFDYPIFDLNLEILEGELFIPKFNLNYTNFEGPLRIDQEGIKLDGATFEDPTGGTASVSGGILFNEYRYFSFDLEALLDEILIMNRDNALDLPFYGQIWGSGTLKLTGPTDNAFLFSQDAITKASSELFIPISEGEVSYDEGFIIFADSTGNIPDFSSRNYRKNLLSKRPEGERRFVDGLDMDLNITVPTGSTIHLVFDPLLGDVINAVSSGRVQLQRREGELSTFGTLSVESGDYLFTAGDVFARRFIIERGGTITWDGNPINARMNIPASYRTRVSTAGLPGNPFNENTLIPLIVRLDISGRVSSPLVELSLESDRSDRNYQGNYEGLEAFLNQSERTTDFATSVLLTNSFLLTTEANAGSGTLTNSGEQIAFSSVSQLVSSQLNRFLNEAIPNADFNLGLQGESLEDPDVTYGVALYLLDERLVIRGQGIYQREITPNQSGLEGEFEVEVRLSPNVSVSVFLRREGDILADNALTSARGAGLSYQTQFSSWNSFLHRLFGWLGKKKKPSEDAEPVAEGTIEKNE